MGASRTFLGILFMTQLMIPQPAQSQTQEDNFLRFGLYVTAVDIERSSVFYEKVFQKQPYVKNDKLVGFDVAGGLFAIFASDGHDRKLVRGNGTVPYIRVRDAVAELDRIKGLSTQVLDNQIVREGPLELFRFEDPDGNVIEFFSLVSSK